MLVLESFLSSKHGSATSLKIVSHINIKCDIRTRWGIVELEYVTLKMVSAIVNIQSIVDFFCYWDQHSFFALIYKIDKEYCGIC